MRAGILAILFVTSAGMAQAADYIVRFYGSEDKSSAKRALERHGLDLVEAIPQLNMYVADGSDKSADVAKLAKAAGVMYVAPNYQRHIVTVPNDKDYKKQHGHKAFGAERAWDIHQGARDVVVAVVDTGVSLNHPDLTNQLWVNRGEVPNNGKDDDLNGFIDDVHGWDFVNKDSDPNDDQSHGSHCAGIIGAEANNGIGVAGVIWNVQIMALKFLNSKGSGSDADSIKSILYAADNGANIINASWGSTEYSQAVFDAIKYAGDKGVLFVAAAGNSTENNEFHGHYPSNYELSNVISVGAATSEKRKADFSNFGRTRVHVAAPGTYIYSTTKGKNYGTMSGTSMASPMVAGEAALIWAAHPELAIADVRNAIMNGVEVRDAWQGKNATDGFARVDFALEQFSAGPQVWPKFVRLVIGRRHAMTAYNVAGAKWAVSDGALLSVSDAGEVTALGIGAAQVLVTGNDGVVHAAQVEVVKGGRSGGCAAAEGDGATSNASSAWPALLFLLPMLVAAFLRRRRMD